MKYAIVFSSQTGNTKQLAEAVSSVLPQADLCFFGSPSQEALQAERLFIGFWTDKGRCNQEISDFLKTLKGKEVFLFGTAGFGGSQEYFDKILSSVQKCLGASNTVIGTYMCQGKMPQSVRERYVKMKNSPLPIPNVDKMIENFDTAVSHPDETDLQKLKYAHKAGDVAAIDAAIAEMNAAWQAANAQMYQGGAQPGAGAQQNAGGQSNANAGNSSSDDTIQDADFEEVK